MEWLPEFYREQRLVITASLPCYLEENVDRQRGKGVYRRSIAALKHLNMLGYGGKLELNLVYNPGGDYIPGSQKELETAYKAELLERHGILFNHLYTITNAPIGRFREYLESQGAYDRYLNLLATQLQPGRRRQYHVPHPGERRLEGVSLQLRFQPGDRPPDHRRREGDSQDRRPGGGSQKRQRALPCPALLLLHGGGRVELHRGSH